MAKSNLYSPTSITSTCSTDDLIGWLTKEIEAINPSAVRSVIKTVSRKLTDFVHFPKEAVLLWEGCDRVPPKGKHQKYHRYPESIRNSAKAKGISLDSRANGPAITAFLFAGGNRPLRTGSANSWSIHHLYSGKFPYLNTTETMHAQKDKYHFTQSAGLIAVHPIADAICDEFPCFSWFLRAEAFRRFGYDPDRVFGESHDRYGFVEGRKARVFNTEYCML